MEVVPHLQTMFVVGAFIALYLVQLVRRTMTGELDLYDFFMLGAVALLPGLFTFAPHFAYAISELMGVTFPFVVMFGALFVVNFLVLNRMASQVHRLERRSRRLVQENGLLRQKLEEALRSR